MIPIYMSVLHDPDNNIYGDCQRACIASLLELNIEDVPHFYEAGNDLCFYRSLNKFLGEKGYFHISVKPFNWGEGQYLDSSDCYHMIYGKTKRGSMHAVVAKNGEIIHDPHPSDACLIDGDKESWDYAFLVAVNDGK